jgi:hypothetical protein
MRGAIYFIRGNVRIQITTDEKVFFYGIDKETLLPSLDNVMYNFMGCTSLMFGSRVKYGIAFTTSSQGLTIYTRKCYHNFKVVTATDSKEGAVGCELAAANAYALATGTKLVVHNQHDFSVRETLVMKPLNENEDVGVLYISVSQDEKKMGVLLGRRLVRREVEISELLIYRLDRRGRWQLEKQMEYEFDGFTCT